MPILLQEPWNLQRKPVRSYGSATTTMESIFNIASRITNFPTAKTCASATFA